MNKTKRTALLARLHQGYLDAGLEPPTFKIKGVTKPLTSSQVKSMVRAFNYQLKLEKFHGPEA